MHQIACTEFPLGTGRQLPRDRTASSAGSSAPTLIDGRRKQSADSKHSAGHYIHFVSAILGHGILASRTFMFENDAHADE